jgi:hypothetical protein
MRAAWVLGLMLALGAGEAAAQRLPFTWDVPKVVEEIEVPGIMRADGIPVKLRSVKSTERPEVILQHMVDRFQAWGFYIPRKRTQWLREPQLTALDTDRLISYTFIIQTNPDGTTTVVLGEANLREKTAKMSPIAPVYPGAKEVVTSDLEVARSVTYLLSGQASPDVEGFYRRELTQLGYTQLEPGIYRKGTEELMVTVRPAKGNQLSVVVLSRTATVENTRSPHAD